MEYMGLEKLFLYIVSIQFISFMGSMVMPVYFIVGTLQKCASVGLCKR